MTEDSAVKATTSAASGITKVLVKASSDRDLGNAPFDWILMF